MSDGLYIIIYSLYSSLSMVGQFHPSTVCNLNGIRSKFFIAIILSYCLKNFIAKCQCMTDKAVWTVRSYFRNIMDCREENRHDGRYVIPSVWPTLWQKYDLQLESSFCKAIHIKPSSLPLRPLTVREEKLCAYKKSILGRAILLPATIFFFLNWFKQETE